MFKGLRFKLGLLAAGFRFFRRKERTRSFAGAVSNSRRALFILPEDPADLRVLETLLVQFVSQTKNRTVSILLRRDLLANFQRTSGFQVITYDANDIGSLFLPRKQLRDRLSAAPFDTIIDLNRHFGLPGAYLALMSSAPLRAGFADKYSDRFFNFCFRASNPAHAERAYRGFFHCLQMF